MSSTRPGFLSVQVDFQVLTTRVVAGRILFPIFAPEDDAGLGSHVTSPYSNNFKCPIALLCDIGNPVTNLFTSAVQEGTWQVIPCSFSFGSKFQSGQALYGMEFYDKEVTMDLNCT